MAAGRSLLLASLFAAGCGSDPVADAGAAEDAGVDAAPDASVPYAPAPPEPPARPELPRIEPCPAGWRAVPDQDDPRIVSCDPFPEAGPRDCPAGQVHWAGGPECALVGPVCPAGRWADDLPPKGVVLRVAPDAADGGDGTAERPFVTIALALDVATEGSIVALARGTYEEPVSVPDGVEVRGACAAETILAPAAAPGRAVVTLARRGGSLRRVTVRGPRSGISVQAADTMAEAVVVEGAREFGISVGSAASVRLVDVVVRDHEQLDGLFEVGAGLLVSGEAEVDVERAAFERSELIAIWVKGGVLVAADLSVRDGRGNAGGLKVEGGARVELERAAFDGNGNYGISLREGGTTLVASDLSIRHTTTLDAGGQGGTAVLVSTGASATLSRASLVDDGITAIVALWPLSRVDATDVVIADMNRGREQVQGGGVTVRDGASLSITRVAVSRSHGFALSVGDAEAEVTDLTAQGTAEVDFGLGHGVVAGQRSTLTLTRAELVGNGSGGILLSGMAAEMTATDLSVRDGAAASSTTEYGQGLAVIHGARATVSRLLCEASQTAAIDVRHFPSELSASDVIVRGTRSRGLDGRFGVGLWVVEGGQATVTRGAFEDGQSFGVISQHAGSLARLEEVVVDGVSVQQCAADSCPAESSGIGLAAAQGGALEARHFVQRAAALCGVQVAGGALDLHEGEVRDNPIGANVQTEGYDLARLQDRVRYLDNERPLDAVEIPVPEPPRLPEPGADP